jgi:hypothetical protein
MNSLNTPEIDMMEKEEEMISTKPFAAGPSMMRSEVSKEESTLFANVEEMVTKPEMKRSDSFELDPNKKEREDLHNESKAIVKLRPPRYQIT